MIRPAILTVAFAASSSSPDFVAVRRHDLGDRRIDVRLRRKRIKPKRRNALELLAPDADQFRLGDLRLL